MHDKRRDVDIVSMEKLGLEKTVFTEGETLIIFDIEVNQSMSFFIQQNFSENLDGYERIVITATLIYTAGKQTITGGDHF